jgi:hypothetical protein
MENISQHNLCFPDALDDAARDLITCLLNPDPSKRLGFTDISEVKAHRFFEGAQPNQAWSIDRRLGPANYATMTLHDPSVLQGFKTFFQESCAWR